MGMYYDNFLWNKIQFLTLTIGGKCSETAHNHFWSECNHVRCLDANQLLYLKSQTSFRICKYPCVFSHHFCQHLTDMNIKNLMK